MRDRTTCSGNTTTCDVTVPHALVSEIRPRCRYFTKRNKFQSRDHADYFYRIYNGSSPVILLTKQRFYSVDSVLAGAPLKQLSSHAFPGNAGLERRRQHNTPNRHEKRECTLATIPTGLTPLYRSRTSSVYGPCSPDAPVQSRKDVV